ncbi:MAG: thioredoxin family protein [Sphingomonadales bacterium]|nr:thioredoxin family protein [Sphingomonadales bacterium]
MHVSAVPTGVCATSDAAQSSDKSIVVDVSATWCPVCKAQHKVLDSLAKNQWARQRIETLLVDLSPAWLTELTTRF